jgi:hypothetical protein
LSSITCGALLFPRLACIIIRSTHASLQGEERLLRDELHRVALELQSRKLALQKLQRKHDTLRLKGRSQDGEFSKLHWLYMQLWRWGLHS